jgi:hypothetical protein
MSFSHGSHSSDADDHKGRFDHSDSTRKLLRTAQAAAGAGVSKQTLQYYLLVGLIEPTEHTSSGQQLFDTKVVERIRLVRQLNESGYPLREIRDIFLRPRESPFRPGPRK